MHEGEFMDLQTVGSPAMHLHSVQQFGQLDPSISGS